MRTGSDSSRSDGLLVVFEGGEGSGKSTQSAALAERIRASGRDVVVTREPGGVELAEQIRELLLSEVAEGMSARCEALLFAAARAEHVESLIRPALRNGAVVVCDRFIDSSVAYQGAGRSLGPDEVARVSAWATQGLVADLTVLLDVDPAVGLARARDPNRLEAAGIEFHREVRSMFLQLASADPGRYLVLPAERPVAELAAEIWSAVRAELPDRVADRTGSVQGE